MSPQTKLITSISAGYEYCMAIENRRAVYAWGKTLKVNQELVQFLKFESQPSKVGTLEGNLIRQVACGETHSLILTQNGDVYSCGHPEDGKLGLGERSTLQITPQKIDKLSHTEVVKIACGRNHSIALAKDPYDMNAKKFKKHSRLQQFKQVVFTWGSGWDSKLGHGNKENLWEPKQVQTSYNFIDIDAGARHSAGLDEDRMMIIWGPYQCFGVAKPDDDKKKKKKKFSDKEAYEFQKPVRHPEFAKKDIKFKKISLGDKYSLGLSETEDIYYWGEFDFSLQCLQQRGEVNMDQFGVKMYQDSFQFQEIHCSRNHAMALSKNQAYSWGYDTNTGRLGLGYSYYDKQLAEEQMFSEDIDQHKDLGKKFLDLSKRIDSPELLAYLSQFLSEQYTIVKKRQAKLEQHYDFMQNKEAEKLQQQQEVDQVDETALETKNESMSALSLKRITSQKNINNPHSSTNIRSSSAKKKTTFIDQNQQNSATTPLTGSPHIDYKVSNFKQIVSSLETRIYKNITFLEELQSSEDGVPDLFNAVSRDEYHIF